MIPTSTRKKCGNCQFFQLSPPASENAKSTYTGRCKRPDWPHATTVGKRACPGYQAHAAIVVPSGTPKDIQQITNAIWYAFSVLTAGRYDRYQDAAEALEYAAGELRTMAAWRVVRK